MNTRLAPWMPQISCCRVRPLSGTLIMFLRAFSIAFWIATGTSRALPYPKPTRPAPSPTTVSAVNVNCLPPLTVFETRFTATSFSLKSPLCESSKL